jgi:predicted ArsR family transcriptional regulator
MARTLDREYEHGKHHAEYVDGEMPPLGEDRKTIFLPDTDTFKMVELGGRTLGLFLTEMLAPLREKYGDEVLEIGRKAMYEVGQRRAATMAKRMKIDDLKDARCLGRIMDLEDNNAGVRGEWVEWGKKRAVKHEYECSQAKAYEKCPEICTVLLEAMEQGTMDALGVKVKTPIITKVLPVGDPYCEVVVELLDDE